jgi:hypothetical protein
MNHARKTAPADATVESLSLVVSKLDAIDKRQREDAADLKADVARLDSKFDRLLETVVSGQAVSTQNDMELKREIGDLGKVLAEVLRRLPT